MPFCMFVIRFPWVRFGVYRDIIHVYREPSLGNLFAEDRVHHSLEGGGRIGEAEEHDCWFEQSLVGEEGCFPFIAFLDPDIIIAPANVESGKESTATEAVNDLWDEWGYIAISDSPFVNGSVVLNGAQFAVSLFDKKEIGHVWAYRTPDGFSFNMFRDKVAGRFDFFLGEG